MITGEIKNKIDNIWDIFFYSGMTNPLSVIEQLTYLIFIKILDDNETIKESNAALLGFDYQSEIFDANHQNCRWKNFKNYEAENMFLNMTECVFPFIKNELHQGKDTAFAKYIKDALFQIPSPRALVKVVDALDELDLSNKDMMGDVYEYILSKIAQSNILGQFRTPRHIIRLMVELMKPTLDDKICDPAMGSAGFITQAAKYVADKYKVELMNQDARNHYNTTMFTGYDTDATMLRIGAMNMMLHDVEAPTIEKYDSLSSENTDRNNYTLILANPPFTGSLDSETISKDLLSVTKTKKTELLFLALFIKMLKIGGRCASIVPDGVLFGSSTAHKAIRKELVENQRLEAVISMPSGVFNPYAGVKTSILVFTKTDNGGTDKVWFYDMTNDGYTLDIKRSPIEGSDIPDILNRFENLKDEETRLRTDKSFFVPVNEIIENDYDLTFNKYKEIVREEKVYRSTKEIMAELRKLEEESLINLKELEKMLGDE